MALGTVVHDLEWRKKEMRKRAYGLPVRVHTRNGRFVFQYGAMVYAFASLADAARRVEQIVGQDWATR